MNYSHTPKFSYQIKRPFSAACFFLSLSDWGYRVVLVVVGRIDRVADGWMGWRFTIVVVVVVVVVDGEVRCVGIGIHATSVHLVLKDDVQGVDDAGDVCRGGLSASGAERLWRTGGKRDLQPRTVNSRLMRRSAPQPRSRKTPRGGSTTAQMILMMSLLGRVSFVLLVVCYAVVV
jgi:hypothetical protein